MSIQIVNRDAFYIVGYMVETCLETAVTDIAMIEKQYDDNKAVLLAMQNSNGHYGLMWYTQNHRYCYLLGVDVEHQIPERESLHCRLVPAARYAVMEVERDQSVFAAWSEFFEKNLPSAGWKPDYNHGMFFEYYPDDGSGSCQLWTPVLPQADNGA